MNALTILGQLRAQIALRQEEGAPVLLCDSLPPGSVQALDVAGFALAEAQARTGLDPESLAQAWHART